MIGETVPQAQLPIKKYLNMKECLTLKLIFLNMFSYWKNKN